MRRILLASLIVLLPGSLRAQSPAEPMVQRLCRVSGQCPDPLPEASTLSVTGQTSGSFEGVDGSPAFGRPFDFQDNRDGTITDRNTGLMWEKKVGKDLVSAPSNPHDCDNAFSWSGTCSPSGVNCLRDGDCPDAETCRGTDNVGTERTAFQWIDSLNAARFAGYDDWRLPNVRELLSLIDFARTWEDYPSASPLPAAVHPALEGASCGASCVDLADPACSCTLTRGQFNVSTGDYVSSTAGDETRVRVIGFASGETRMRLFRERNGVRAVRGGVTASE